MILLYRILTVLFYPLLILIIYYRRIKKKEDQLRFKEKIFASNFNVVRKANSKLIWFHAASIGEMKSIMPIIKELNKKKNKFDILVTTTTLSSSSLAKIEFGQFRNVLHRFFPLDVDSLVKKFLKKWQPNFIFLVDSEIWPNLIINAENYKIPLAIINARITKKSSKRWLLFPKTSKFIFNKINLCLSSNQETTDFLSRFNKRVFNIGNIKLMSEINHNYKQDINWGKHCKFACKNGHLTYHMKKYN